MPVQPGCRGSGGLAALLVLGLAWVSVDRAIGRVREEEQKKLTAAEERRAEELAELEYHTRYTADVRRGLDLWEQGNIAQVKEILEAHRPHPDRKDLREFTWRYLSRLVAHPGRRDWQAIDAHDGGVESVEYSPDGKYFATAGKEGVRTWDAATRAPLGQPFVVAENSGLGIVFDRSPNFSAAPAAIVTKVVPDGVADEAGVAAGDQIVGLKLPDGDWLHAAAGQYDAMVAHLLDRARPVLELELARTGESQTRRITIRCSAFLRQQ